MNNKEKYPERGLFITGTGTEVGKTYVGCLIATSLRRQGLRVGVYKPAASGCHDEGEGTGASRGRRVSEDAVSLWEAAGEPGNLDWVCPQRFLAPLAPHLAAQSEGRRVDESRLTSGLEIWRGECDFVVVEGAGGLMSPLSDSLYNADVACQFGYPLLVVAANRLGAINETLQTLITACTFRDGLEVAGVVLNDVAALSSDASRHSNGQEIANRCVPPLLAEVAWQQQELAVEDWPI